MTNEEFEQILSYRHETRGVEFKGPGPRTDGRLFAQVSKAVLGMSNRRNGGAVIVGVADSDQFPNLVGLSETELATWTYDETAAGLARYADPSVSFDLETIKYNGGKYLVFDVAEFPEIPVLCKRAFDTLLRAGACYVRTHRMPETSEIPTQTEMRELLEIATEKRLRLHLDYLRRVGLIDLPPPEARATEGFRRQRGILNE